MRNKEDFKVLGHPQEYEPQSTFTYHPEVLEVFDNRHPGHDYWVKFNCPEFTTLCPVTGQPDFARIYIAYVPDKLLVESKSLKLYLMGFRQRGDFHEDVVNTIMEDLVACLKPHYIEVWGKFNPRGGISIDPYVNYGAADTKYEALADLRFSRQFLPLDGGVVSP